jgi:hypothetical protein
MGSGRQEEQGHAGERGRELKLNRNAVISSFVHVPDEFDVVNDLTNTQ